MRLSAAQVDRACGVLLGAAVGDALGAGYEFGAAPLVGRPEMIGGGLGNFAPGEWTDDTAQTYAIAHVAASCAIRGADLRTEAALDRIAAGFAAWYAAGPPDVGIQTSHVLGAVRANPTARAMTETAAALHRRTGRTAGNGSLMRTSPVALAHLADEQALVDAAMAVSALTHADPLAGEACVLWCLAIRHAVLTGELGDPRAGLARLPADRREFWREKLEDAERLEPATFRPNGFVVTALQAAWSAISHTAVPSHQPAAGRFASDHLVAGLEAAIAIGDDTDTVATIAGALLGARWGESAVPARWRRVVHGYPGLRAEDLTQLAFLAVAGGPNRRGWPGAARIEYAGHHGRDTLVPHPHDEGVWIGGVGALDVLPPDVTAVVSLCLVGATQVPAGLEHVSYRLLDEPDRADNPNLDFVLDDAARTIAALREEGHVVLLHCVAAHSRTPAVAIRYSQLLGIDPRQAYDEVCAALPNGRPNAGFRKALRRLSASTPGDRLSR